MTRPDTYFTHDKKTLRAQLLDREARDEAEKWNNITSSQIRRYFGQVTADRRRLEIIDNAEDEARVAMAMLKAATAYTAAKESKRKPIADFVAHHAGLVKSQEEFFAFARHFEAVVAWHKVFEKQKAQFAN